MRAAGREDLAADPLQRLVQDDPQFGERVLPRRGARLPGQPAQVADEALDRLLQVPQRGGVRPAGPSPAPGRVGPARPAGPLPVPRGRPGLLAFLPRPFLRVLPGPPGVLARFVPDPPRLFLGLFPAPATPLPDVLGLRAQLVSRGRALAARLVRLPGAPGRPGQLLTQVAHRFPDVFLDLTDHVPDRVGQFLLQFGQLVLALVQFLASRVGDPVYLPPVHLIVGDQAFLFQPGQSRVDRAG